MSTSGNSPDTLPAGVVRLLRLEGLAVFAAALAAYHLTGGNWWLFLLLILAPDLAMLGMLLGPTAGARFYNGAHTYALPLVLGGLAWLTAADWLLPLALIWIAHIGADRALGYGLKYPGSFEHTHLGRIGRAKRAARATDAG